MEGAARMIDTHEMPQALIERGAAFLVAEMGMEFADAVDRLTVAARPSARTLDDFGITIRLADTYLHYAHEHAPHLLRSKKKRQRRKAERVLTRTMPAHHKRRAFQMAASGSWARIRTSSPGTTADGPS